jgi:hypothetical protein
MSKNAIESDLAIGELALGITLGETSEAIRTNKARIKREATKYLFNAWM